MTLLRIPPIRNFESLQIYGIKIKLEGIPLKKMKETYNQIFLLSEDFIKFTFHTVDLKDSNLKYILKNIICDRV